MRDAVTIESVLVACSGLLSEDGANPEYDRALAEVVCTLLGLPVDYRETAMAALRHTKAGTGTNPYSCPSHDASFECVYCQDHSDQEV